MKITGKITEKRYRCTECGAESLHATNHYGCIYPRCRACGWKKPMQMSQVHECMEKAPEGWGIPEKWSQVKLGDVVDIIEVEP